MNVRRAEPGEAADILIDDDGIPWRKLDEAGIPLLNWVWAGWDVIVQDGETYGKVTDMIVFYKSIGEGLGADLARVWLEQYYRDGHDRDFDFEDGEDDS